MSKQGAGKHSISPSVDHLLCLAARTFSASLGMHLPLSAPILHPDSSPMRLMESGYLGAVLHLSPLFLPCQGPDTLKLCFRFQPDLGTRNEERGEQQHHVRRPHCAVIWGRSRRPITMTRMPFSSFFISWPTHVRTGLPANKQPRQSNDHGTLSLPCLIRRGSDQLLKINYIFHNS